MARGYHRLPKVRPAPGFDPAHSGNYSSRKNQINMKKGVTIISILVAVGAALVLWLGGFLSGEQKPTEPKFDISATIANADSFSVWEVLPVWKRNTFLGDYMATTPVQISKATQPTPEDITKIVRLPGGILGKWECVAFLYVKQIKPGKPPIEEQP
ncbi:MAG: hypothetical protein ACRCWC_12730, partial [Plesiomonas shigelloides]